MHCRLRTVYCGEIFDFAIVIYSIFWCVVCKNCWILLLHLFYHVALTASGEVDKEKLHFFLPMPWAKVSRRVLQLLGIFFSWRILVDGPGETHRAEETYQYNNNRARKREISVSRECLYPCKLSIFCISQQKKRNTTNKRKCRRGALL